MIILIFFETPKNTDSRALWFSRYQPRPRNQGRLEFIGYRANFRISTAISLARAGTRRGEYASCTATRRKSRRKLLQYDALPLLARLYRSKLWKKRRAKLEQISLKDPTAYGRIHDEMKALVRVHECERSIRSFSFLPPLFFERSNCITSCRFSHNTTLGAIKRLQKKNFAAHAYRRRRFLIGARRAPGFAPADIPAEIR